MSVNKTCEGRVGGGECRRAHQHNLYAGTCWLLSKFKEVCVYVPSSTAGGYRRFHWRKLALCASTRVVAHGAVFINTPSDVYVSVYKCHLVKLKPLLDPKRQEKAGELLSLWLSIGYACPHVHARTDKSSHMQRWVWLWEKWSSLKWCSTCTAIAWTERKEFGGVGEFVLLLILKYARAPAASGNEDGIGAECKKKENLSFCVIFMSIVCLNVFIDRLWNAETTETHVKPWRLSEVITLMHYFIHAWGGNTHINKDTHACTHSQRKRCTADQTGVTTLPAHSACSDLNKPSVRSESEKWVAPLSKAFPNQQMGCIRGLRDYELQR